MLWRDATSLLGVVVLATPVVGYSAQEELPVLRLSQSLGNPVAAMRPIDAQDGEPLILRFSVEANGLSNAAFRSVESAGKVHAQASSTGRGAFRDDEPERQAPPGGVLAAKAGERADQQSDGAAIPSFVGLYWNPDQSNAVSARLFEVDGTLLAASDDDDAGGGARAATVDVPAGEKVPPAPARETGKATAANTPWRRTPIRWSGNLQTGLNLLFPNDGKRVVTWSDQASVALNSYVYAPWFIKVNGTGYYNSFRLSAEDSRSSMHSFGGSVVTSIFPQSRFPGSVSLSNDYTLFNQKPGGKGHSTSTRFGLNQAYAPVDGKFNTSGVFDYANNSSTNGNRNSSARLSGNYFQRFPGDDPQDLNATFNYFGSDSRFSPVNGLGVNASSNGVSGSARHSIFLSDYVMSLINTADAGWNSFRSADGQEFGSTTLGARSTMDWLPSDDYDVRILGYSNMSYASLDAGGQNVSFASADINYATSPYKINDYLNVSGGVFANYTDTPETSTLTGGVYGNLGFTAGSGLHGQDALNLAGWTYSYSYGLNAGLGGGFGANTLGGTGQQGSAQITSTAAHSLSRTFPNSFGGGVLKAAFQQSVSGSYSPGGNSPFGGSIQADGIVDWRLNRSDGASFGAKLDGRNLRSYGEYRSTLSDINASADGMLPLSPHSTLSSSLGVSASQQRLQDLSIRTQQLTPTGTVFTQEVIESSRRPWVWSASGAVTYANGYFLRIPRLNYTLTYSASLFPGSSIALGDTSASGIVSYHQLKQRATYAIGLLTAELTHTLNYSQGRMDNLIFIMLSRSLSGVL